MAAVRPRSYGLRLTKVGLWFVVFAVVVAVAAFNTGNNGLYLVLALMVGVVLASQILAAWNVRGLDVDLRADEEIFANRPTRLRVRIGNRSRFASRWLLGLAIEPPTSDDRGVDDRGTGAGSGADPSPRSTPLLFERVAPREETSGEVELLLRRRGRRHLRQVRISSLFPFGLFRKGVRYPSDLELLVYPEIFPAGTALPEESGKSGHEPRRREGWSHELLALRAFRAGDDPRGIHWKQSARTGALVFKVREAEETRRLVVVLDNAVGELADDGRRQRFERLVSEAASAAVEYLDRGYEVELVTRDRVVPFGSGARQRRRVLEHLALVEAVAARADALTASDSRAPHLLLAMESGRVKTAGEAA